MKSKTFVAMTFWMAGILLCVPGCIRVNYIPAEKGRTFEPLEKEDHTEICYEESRIPGSAGNRVLLGSAEGKGSTSYCTLSGIKNKLLACAREAGANVVLVTEINHKEFGTVRSDQVKNLAAPTWTPVDDSGSNVTSQRNMDLYMTGNDPDLPVYEITVKARFYRIPKDLLVKDPVLLRGNPKPGRRTAPKKDDTTIRIR